MSAEGLADLQRALPIWVRLERRMGEPTVTEHEAGGASVVEVKAFPEAPANAVRADVHFVVVAPTEGFPDRDDLVATVRGALGAGEFAHMSGEDLAGGPSYITTLRLLGYEIDQLDGYNVALEIDIAETDLKLNGELRANARPSSPAVAVAFETPKHGQLIYQCDHLFAAYYHQGPDWHHNVRAIAKHLESQRAQDRWGVTGVAGGVYGGFKAIGGGATAMPAATPSMSKREAAELIERLAIGEEGDVRERVIARILNGSEPPRTYREARSMVHPDHRDGDHDLAYKVDEALRVLGVR